MRTTLATRGHLPRWLHFLLAAVLAAGGLLTAGSAQAESNGGVRVMPLGDSITEGTQVPGGYRIGLWQRFTGGRYRVDLVGSQFNGPNNLGDHDHEGHPGWRIDQIDANITNWVRNTSPRTVLLHIGTNDVLQNFSLATAPNRLSTLVDHITAAAPAADVFVATIIPLSNASQEAGVRRFNAAVPGIVQSKANAGRHVHLVDMHAALTAADLIDGIHPTANGYDKMAATWFNAVRSVPGTIGDPGGEFSTEAVWSSTDKWGTWSNGGYTVRNDVWGSGAGPQTIWANSFSNWGVWANHPNTGGVKAYPHSARNIGRNLSGLRSLSSSFDVTRPGGGAYATAYDIWANNNAYEVMLWMNKQGAVGPLGSKQTTASVGGHTWDVYRGSNGANAVFSFVRTGNTNSGSVDVLAVMNWIRSRGWFGDVTLGEVQFGFEITSSSGGMDFVSNGYSVSFS